MITVAHVKEALRSRGEYFRGTFPSRHATVLDVYCIVELLELPYSDTGSPPKNCQKTIISELSASDTTFQHEVMSQANTAIAESLQRASYFWTTPASAGGSS